MRDVLGKFVKGHKFNLGSHYTEERKRKMSESHKKIKNHSGRFQKGHKGFRKIGEYKHNKETKGKISETLKRKGIKPPSNLGKHLNVKEKNPSWRGGISQGYIKKLTERKWHKIRKEIYKRDKWTCQICGIHCKKGEIQCHHIVPYRISKDDNFGNLITLCLSCHMKEEHKYYRSLKTL